MLSRIDTIKEMKDGYSLDELSDFFSPNPTKIEIGAGGTALHLPILSEHTPFSLYIPFAGARHFSSFRHY